MYTKSDSQIMSLHFIPIVQSGKTDLKNKLTND